MITIHCGARWPGSHAQPVQDLARLRPLGPDVNYAHLNETSDADLRLIADSGGTVSISPMIELMCGHGRPSTGKLLAVGLRPTLSADATVNVPGDMFSEIRTALAHERHLALPDDIAAGQVNTIPVTGPAGTVVTQAGRGTSTASWSPADRSSRMACSSGPTSPGSGPGPRARGTTSSAAPVSCPRGSRRRRRGNGS